ncbi:MAG: N-acetylmuramoyl-L-alanine amidase [Bacteroidota bacterium]
MRTFLPFFCSLLSATFLLAQAPQRAVLLLNQADQIQKISKLKDARIIYRSTSQVVPIEKVTPFLAYSITHELEDLELWIRFSENGENWKDWEKVKKDIHEGEVEEGWVSELMFARKKDRFFQYQWENSMKKQATLLQLKIHFYSPGKTTKNTNTSNRNQLENRSCPCEQPAFEEREDWCPSGDCPKDSTPAANTVTHLIVHHSAGVNVANDWSAVVRSIWDFHVNTRGWDDVGYNWLVDPNGVIYEGRGTNLIGAHFCGRNTNTEGICLLGDFTNITPTEEAFNKLVQFLAWKSCDRDLYPIDRVRHAPSGKNLLQVSGHRDGCATACPGNSFYPLFDNLREATVEYIDNNCSISPLLPTPYALTDSLVGTEKIQLNWAFDTPSSNIKLSLERSDNEDFRYEEIARLDSDINTYEDSDIEINQLYYYRLRALSNGEASAYSNKVIVNTNVVGLNQYLNSSTVQIYPNPIQGVATLSIQNEIRGEVAIEIQDVVGRRIQQLQWNKTQELLEANFSLSNLAKGLYLLQIRQGEHQLTMRVIKE